MRIEARDMGDRLAGVLGRPGKLKGLGAVEGRRGADLTRLVRLENQMIFSTKQSMGGFEAL